MITIQTIRTALEAADPYTEMDLLIRIEMNTGRKVIDIFNDINPLVDKTLETVGLTEEGEEAFLGTIDALTGGCRPESNYYDPPNPAQSLINGVALPSTTFSQVSTSGQSSD